jgi:hypothetical protein
MPLVVANEEGRKVKGQEGETVTCPLRFPLVACCGLWSSAGVEIEMEISAEKGESPVDARLRTAESSAQ